MSNPHTGASLATPAIRTGAGAPTAFWYLSGPVSGLDISEARRVFAKAEEYLRSRGLVPVNPMRSGVPVPSPWEEHMRADIKAMLGCSGILMLPGWERSRGARLEHEIAKELGFEIEYEDGTPEPAAALPPKTNVSPEPDAAH